MRENTSAHIIIASPRVPASRHFLNSFPTGDSVIRERFPLQTLLLGILLAVICLNVLQFTTTSANPLIISDDWHAVDAVVSKIPAGDFQVVDLFTKRGALDHSQPLRKAILVFHYRYFDLDFGVEALIGVLFAFVNLALFWALARSTDGEGRRITWAGMLGFAALAAVYLSLNAEIVFGWPLLTLAYTSHTFILVAVVAAWYALSSSHRARLPLLFGAALTMDMVTDDTGLVVSLAILLALAIEALRGSSRTRLLQVAGTVILAAAVYNIGYMWLVPKLVDPAAGKAAGLATSIARLWGQAPDAWQWVVTPLSSSLADRLQLREMLGSGSQTVPLEIMLAVLVLVGHAWFWWAALRGRRNRAAFVATCLMLMFYGLLAAMLLARVSVRDVSYLLQPRYVIIYMWNVVALLLMAIGQVGDAPATGATRALPLATSAKPRVAAGPLVLSVVAVALLLLQVPLSLTSWHRTAYTRIFQQRMALQVSGLLEHPAAPTGPCMPQLVVCRFPQEQRERVLRFIKSHRLNLYSRKFQIRNRLYPAIGCVPWDPAKASVAADKTCSN